MKVAPGTDPIVSMERFIEKWCHPRYPPVVVVASQELDRAERMLGFKYPADYRTSVLRCGLPILTIELLDRIVDLSVELECVSNFLTPLESIETTVKMRVIGLGPSYLAFATDECGSLFCFDLDDLRANKDSCPIWYFDHDFISMDLVSPSFADWIASYVGIPK